MKRFYILTFVDLVRVGFNVDDVFIYDDVELANKKMQEMYLEKCKESGIEDPMSDDSYDYQFCENGYAYISDRYYWDIFNKDLYNND